MKEPLISPADKAEYAALGERCKALKKEITACDRQARAEGKRPIERKRLLEALKQELKEAESRLETLKGRLIELGRAAVLVERNRR